jgi:hypothetical protein
MEEQVVRLFSVFAAAFAIGLLSGIAITFAVRVIFRGRNK